MLDDAEDENADLEGFDNTVQLSRSQLTELLDRARRLKHQGTPARPLLSVPPGPDDAGVIAVRHPVQVLADLLSMSEHSGLPLDQIAFCCTGDGSSSVAQSLMLAGAALGMDVRIAAPVQYWPADGAVARARQLARSTGAALLITADHTSGTDGVHFVVAAPFGSRQVTTVLTAAAAHDDRPPAVRALSEEQAVNRLWVLEAALADWLVASG